jgi:hypothetical protein
MTITLTRKQIDAALPKVEQGLGQYLWLQGKIAGQNAFHQDTEFRRKYNHFYRMRRGTAWQDAFYGLMERAKREQLQFHVVLDLLHQATNRYEASFASKLIATINPSMPVIDSIVLKNLGLRLPYSTSTNRAEQICKLHQKLTDLFGTFLSTEDSKYLVEQFKTKYPEVNITEVKMLDLVLWQTRA